MTMLRDKYRPIIDLANQLHIRDIDAQEANGRLTIKGTAPYQMEKNMLWDKIKSFGGWENELAADIKVEHNDVYGMYQVQSGDTLSKVAQKFYGDSAKYRQIYDANRDVLKDPDKINVGQKLKLPNP
jgi:nucleoid-associated protein YgaU